MKYKTILVEDEIIALKNLKRILCDYKDKIEIIGTASNGEDAVDLINNQRPDLIFLDIQIPGFDGFEVLKRLDYYPMIIFTTAYSEYALKSFESMTIDYILKPISSQKIKKALDKIDEFASKSEWNDLIENLIARIGNKSRLPITINDRIIFVKHSEIYFCVSDSKYTRVHLFEKSYLISKTLAELEDELSSDFIRIHRSNLVNQNYISEIHKLSSKKWIAKMSDKKGSELAISRDVHNKFV